MGKKELPSERAGGELDYGQLHQAALRMARQQGAGKYWIAPADCDDLAAHAVKKLMGQQAKEEVLNHEAFMSRVIRNRINDLGRHAIVVGKFVQHKRGGSEVLTNSRPIIQREENRYNSLKAAGALAILTKDIDRAIMQDRFSPPGLTITELARLHNQTPNSMANYLQKMLGGNNRVGSLEAVFQVIGELSLPTADVFVRILQEFDNRNRVTDPISAAIGQLEYVGGISEEHQQWVKLGISRLKWFGRHEINNRGQINKHLNRLVTAACFYVIEVRDAKNDEEPAGLRDDVSVLAAVYRAVRDFETK
jgi:hypothetical protein